MVPHFLMELVLHLKRKACLQPFLSAGSGYYLQTTDSDRVGESRMCSFWLEENVVRSPWNTPIKPLSPFPCEWCGVVSPLVVIRHFTES